MKLLRFYSPLQFHGARRCASAAVVATIFVNAAAAQSTLTLGREEVRPLEFNGDVRALPSSAGLPAAPAPRQKTRFQGPPSLKSNSVVSPGFNLPLAPMPSPVQNFAGLNFTDSITGGQAGAGWPPDPNGEVGRNHYVEAVNDAYAIYNKTGTRLAAFTENSLWSAGGTNACNGNSNGDPVVIYDPIADRFILTHFAFALDISGNPVSPFYECIAVAKTSDPVAGGWWLYPLRMDPGGTGFPPVGTLNDYPKFGIWIDCLYMSANEFTGSTGAFVGTAIASLSRSDLESGALLTWAMGFINNTTDPFTMIPSNILGASTLAMPPAGTPNYFVSESQTAFAFEVRKFTAGTNCGGGGSLGAAVNVSQSPYTVPFGDLVAQPNTAILLDSLEDRLMQKVQYRKVASAESLWVTHDVQTSVSSPVTMQWAQINVTGGTIATTPVQQQIYAPDTTLNRWMGSIAADNVGNVALGYSTSNGTSSNFPSIAYSGRLAGDAANTLPQTEAQLIAGLGSQTHASIPRWGDYSAMSVDPSDDCTFWYTNEYYSSQTNGTAGNWQNRIGSFKFPGCVAVAPFPSAPVLASPLNGATGITLAPTLNWNASTGATSYDVYFGTVNPPPMVTNTAGTSYAPGTLVAGTTYLWRVVAKNGATTNSSATWSFTTFVNGAKPISVTPSSGTAGHQVFTFVTRDLSGANSVQYVQFLFSKHTVSALNACYVSHDPTANVFYLLSDDMTQWYGLLGGVSGNIGNSQCTIYGATSGSTKLGTDVTTTLDVSFRSGFAP